MSKLIFTDLNNVLRIEKKKYIICGLKAHIIKEPTLYQWVQIKTIDYKKLSPERILKEIISIMIPDMPVEDLDENQLFKIGNECIDIFNNGLEEEIKQENTSSKVNELQNQDSVYIKLDYLILKCCKFTNMSYKEVLNLNVFTFFNIISSIKAIEAEELLNLSTIYDNHLNLKSKNSASNYKKTLEKYKEDFKNNGIKVIRGLDTLAIKQLQAMTKGGAL